MLLLLRLMLVLQLLRLCIVSKTVEVRLNNGAGLGSAAHECQDG
jgi:hypothetical protein